MISDFPQTCNAPTYLANPDASCLPSEPVPGASLFSPDGNTVLGLNATGILLWQALAKPHTRDGLVSQLLARFDGMPADRLAADVDAFLQALQPRGFVGLVLELQGTAPSVPNVEMGSRQEESPASLGHQGAEVVADDCNRFYRGRSMTGTFRPGDRLLVEPMPLEAIRRGDVVLYRRGGLDGALGEVVHRVVARLPGALLTQGDNNSRADRAPVTQDRLVGRVTRLDRAGRVHPVWGGHAGLVRVSAIRSAQRARRLCASLLRPVARPLYRWLRQGGLVQRLWRPEIVRLLVTTRRGPLVKYLVGGRTVAWWWPESGRFGCRRPYDLLIGPPPREGGNHS